jgi:PAS domain S-box-containing protein
MQPADNCRFSVSDSTAPASRGTSEKVPHDLDPRQILSRLLIPVAISRVVDGQITLANAACAKLFGAPEQTLRGRDLGSFFSKLSQRRALAQSLREDGAIHGAAVESRREDGTPLWLSVWQQRVTSDNQECILTILIDRTASQAEKRLVDQRDELLSLLELADHDRETIAYDIHDGVVQEMIGALMHVDAALRAVQAGKPDAVEQLQTVARLLRDGILEARRLIDRVRPPDLEDGGLPQALRSLVDKLAATAQIAIDFQLQGTCVRLASKWETAVYRIVQEALNNVRRHSRTRRARVEVAQHDQRLTLVIEDWGIGFDPSQVSEKLFGLRGLRQRAQLLGGTVQITSKRGAGTRIQVELPLPGEALVKEAPPSDPPRAPPSVGKAPRKK